MRIFLAGGTGYVGGELLREFVHGGHDVTCLSRNPANAPQDPHVRALTGDVADPAGWAGAVEGHDAVVNAVGILRERGRNTFRRVVVDGTKNLVAAAEHAKVRRFIQVSANGVEDAQVPYQTTKLEAEDIVKASTTRWTIFRPSILYGARDASTTMIAKVMRAGIMPVMGDGNYRLAPLAVMDFRKGVAQALVEPKAIGQVYEACGPDDVSWREFLRLVARASGRSPLMPGMPKWMALMGAKVAAVLPWTPADSDAVRMLVSGNTCKDDRWVRDLRIQRTHLAEGLQYLRQKG